MYKGDGDELGSVVTDIQHIPASWSELQGQLEEESLTQVVL